MKKTIIHWLCYASLGLWLTAALPAKPSNSITNYLTRVYPLLPTSAATPTFAHSLDFYYAPFLPALKINTHAKQFYCLAWMYACGNVPNGAIFRNHYQHTPFKYRAGHTANDYIEVMHYKWYEEPALYFYAAKGSGIFLNIGNTLVARNKIETLKKMGFSDEQIIAIAPPSAQNYIQHIMSEQHLSYKTALHYVIQAAINNTNYTANRLAGGASYDIVLAEQCRRHHYATFQFTIQPNDNGSWGYEVMDCRRPRTMPLRQRWIIEQRYLSQRNPLNLKQARACHYKVPFSKWVTCNN